MLGIVVEESALDRGSQLVNDLQFEEPASFLGLLKATGARNSGLDDPVFSEGVDCLDGHIVVASLVYDWS